MKKNYSILLFIFITSVSFSQISKGTKSIGISFSGEKQNNSSENTNGNKTSYNSYYFNVQPNFNLFVKDNLSFGVNIGYSNLGNSSKSAPYTILQGKGNGYSGGLSTSYYIQMSNRFYFSIGGSLNYTYTQTNYLLTNQQYPDIDTEKFKEISNVISAQINPSILFFVTPKLGLKATFGNIYFSNQFGKLKETNSANPSREYSYGLNLSSNSFSFGLSYYF